MGLTKEAGTVGSAARKTTDRGVGTPGKSRIEKARARFSPTISENIQDLFLHLLHSLTRPRTSRGSLQAKQVFTTKMCHLPPSVLRSVRTGGLPTAAFMVSRPGMLLRGGGMLGYSDCVGCLHRSLAGVGFRPADHLGLISRPPPQNWKSDDFDALLTLNPRIRRRLRPTTQYGYVVLVATTKVATLPQYIIY